MIRRIICTCLIVLATAGALGCWFYFVGALSAQGRGQTRCGQVKIVLLDSLESGIVNRKAVQKEVEKQVIGRVTDSIDLDAIERQIRANGEVMTAQVFTGSPQSVNVHITQRKPVLRLEGAGGRWYADPEGYLFPVTNTVDVPIVTGRLPMQLTADWRGPAPEAQQEWMRGMIALAQYIDSRDILRQEIEQIDIAPDGDIVLYTRTPGPAVIFGDYGDCSEKFRKLEAWWRNIAPQTGETTYKTINLKYNHQIICKQL